MKKYIYNHPEISPFFKESSSYFYGNTWSPYRQNYIGGGLKLDEKLLDKRWELNTRILNNDNDTQAFVSCQILYFSPTDFSIEYLRVDIGSPMNKKITIIDGRREAKTWIGEYEDKDIRKRHFPKYRDRDDVQY